MSRESLLREGRGWIVLTLALSGEYLDEVLFKLAFLRQIYLRVEPNSPVTLGQLIDILEDEDLGLSDESAVSLLEDSGLLGADGGGWRTTEMVQVSHPLRDEASATDLEATHAEIAELLSGGGADVLAAPLDLLLASLDRTTKWGLAIAAAQPEELNGVPCFWDYDEDGYRPFNLDPASVTTSDALRLVVERVRLEVPMPSLTEEERGAALSLWGTLLALAREDSPWNRGAFSVAGEDDDFVGAFDPARPELGPCPTVDATGGAVSALCAAVEAGLEDGEGQLAMASREALADAVGFLLRCQLPSGGWPLYRYEDDAYSMVERDVSSWYAAEALADAMRLGILEAGMAERCRAAATDLVGLAEQTAKRSDQGVSWAPDFFAPHASDAQRIRATATVSLALGALVTAWPELEDRVRPLREEAARMVEKLWAPDPDALAVVDFRVPTWDGPAPTRFPWEWPLDALAVQMLADIDVGWDVGTSERLAEAVGGFLGTEVNGHWNDVLMKRESGQDRAVVGSTIFFHSAILAYARRQAEMAAGFFASQPGPSLRVGGRR